MAPRAVRLAGASLTIVLLSILLLIELPAFLCQNIQQLTQREVNQDTSEEGQDPDGEEGQQGSQEAEPTIRPGLSRRTSLSPSTQRPKIYLLDVYEERKACTSLSMLDRDVGS